MTARHNPRIPDQSTSTGAAQSRWAVPMILLVIASFALGIYLLKNGESGSPQHSPSPSPSIAPATVVASPANAAPANELQTMQVAQAVMVTAELSFPDGVPSISEALSQIQRSYAPADGVGRTFAVLDAYGGPTADGKLHISMHVSSEKPGTGQLIFKRTGEVLWHSRIEGTNAASAKTLNVYIADATGTSWIVDGSGNPASILEAKLRDNNKSVGDVWPDGAEREVTFIYSACGCPVKAMVKRVGERTVRTKDLPVIFPDDPGAVQVISRLMRWAA